MAITEQERFLKRTRWVYYKAGVAYGPFSADELLDMIARQELDPAVEVMEMGSGRRGPLGGVALFAKALAESHKAAALRRDEHEFEKSRATLGRSRTTRLVLINVALPLLLLGGLGAGLWYGMFHKPSNGRRATLVEEELRAPLPVAAPVEAAPAAPKTEFKEAEAAQEVDEGIQDYALQVMAKANKQNEVAPVLVAKEAPKPVTLGREVKRSATKDQGGAKAQKAQDDESSMDFSEDELGAAPSASDLVQDRLTPVLDDCASQLGSQLGQEVSLTATVQVKPTGRLASLRLSANVETGLTETRICVQAGMASIRVPPFEGPAFDVTVAR